jgi:hypothetical protein
MSQTVAKKTTTKTIDHGFGKHKIVELENGRSVRVEKWSIRKAATMGRALSDIGAEFVSILDLERNRQQSEAQKEAEVKGLKPSDPEYPKLEDHGAITLTDFVSALPVLLDKAFTQFAFIIKESLHTREGDQTFTEDEILDSFTFEHDLPEVLSAIIALNITESSLGKWKALASGGALFGKIMKRKQTTT